MTKNRFLKIATFSFLCLGMIACSQEDDFTPDTGKDTPITITSVSVSDVVVTRADGTTPLVGTSDAPVTMTTVVTGSSAKYSSAYYGEEDWEHDGTGWKLTGGTQVLFEGNGANQTIVAFSPMIFLNSNGKIYFSLEDGLQDWLFAEPTGLSSAQVDITFKHLFSKVTVNVTHIGNEVSGDITSLSIGSLPNKLILNPADENKKYFQYEEGETYDGETALASTTVPDGSTYQAIYEGIVFPRTTTESLAHTIIVSIDGRYFFTTIQPERTEGSDTIYGFEAGYHYTVNLKVGLDKIEVESITTDTQNPWNGGWGEDDTELN